MLWYNVSVLQFRAGKQGKTMDTKNYTQVLIDGTIYTLGGSEEESYLQKAASYVNDKIAQMRRLPGFSKQNADYQTVMTELNIADDYFKAMEWADSMERQKNDLEKETYSLKHELVSTQMKLEAVLKDLEERQKELDHLTRAMDRKEGELTEARSGLGETPLKAGQTGTERLTQLRILEDVRSVSQVEVTEEIKPQSEMEEGTAMAEQTAAADAHTAGLSDEELAKRALQAAKKANSHKRGRR